MSQDEFQINDRIKLELINDRTVIFLRNALGWQRFNHCKYLLIQPPENPEPLEIITIDEAQAKYSKKLEHVKIKEFGITPQQEFWGHCSNIQAWVEHNYNPGVLHSSLSIPLIRELGRNDKKVLLVALLEIERDFLLLRQIYKDDKSNTNRNRILLYINKFKDIYLFENFEEHEINASEFLKVVRFVSTRNEYRGSRRDKRIAREKRRRMRRLLIFKELYKRKLKKLETRLLRQAGK